MVKRFCDCCEQEIAGHISFSVDSAMSNRWPGEGAQSFNKHWLFCGGCGLKIHEQLSGLIAENVERLKAELV